MKRELKNIVSPNGFWWFLRYMLKATKTDRLLSDKTALNLLNRCKAGKPINWKSPKEFNDKLSWLKVYGRDPLYNKLADKFAVKSFVEERIGKEFVVPCYGVWQNFDDIDFSKLPNQFVLKCTHDSSGVYVCKDKSQMDFSFVRNLIEQSLHRNYYWEGREWIYKDIPPRVLADKYLDDGRKGELQDYKWWCFNGEPRVMYITNKGIAGQVYENFYDMDYNAIDIDHGFPRTVPEYQKPAEFDQMKELARKLSSGIPFVRIDFFDINGKLYFGEFTFYDHAGLRPFGSKEWSEKLGSWIELPEQV